MSRKEILEAAERTAKAREELIRSVEVGAPDNAQGFDLAKWASDESNHQPITRTAVRELLAQRDDLRRQLEAEKQAKWERDELIFAAEWARDLINKHHPEWLGVLSALNDSLPKNAESFAPFFKEVSSMTKSELRAIAQRREASNERLQ